MLEHRLLVAATRIAAAAFVVSARVIDASSVLPVVRQVGAEVFGDDGAAPTEHGAAVRCVFGTVGTVVQEAAEVLVAELLVVHREEQEHMPALVHLAGGRHVAELRRDPEELQRILEEHGGVFLGELELLHDAIDDRAVLVLQNTVEGRGLGTGD